MRYLILSLSLQALQGYAFSWISGTTSDPLHWQRLTSDFQAHVMDLINAFETGGELMDYFIRFTNNLDPNEREGLGIYWPKWDPAKPKALILTDDIRAPLVIEDDNYRSCALEYFENLTIRYPI